MMQPKFVIGDRVKVNACSWTAPAHAEGQVVHVYQQHTPVLYGVLFDNAPSMRVMIETRLEESPLLVRAKGQ